MALLFVFKLLHFAFSQYMHIEEHNTPIIKRPICTSLSNAYFLVMFLKRPVSCPTDVRFGDIVTQLV
jgi:hypothetical protein